MRPPTTTTARGRWISEPGPWANSSGTRLSTVMVAVMRTGRRRLRHPSTIASPVGLPCSSSCVMYERSTMPLSTAMPNRAMKPTEAGTDR